MLGLCAGGYGCLCCAATADHAARRTSAVGGRAGAVMVGLLPSQGVGSRTAVRSEIKPSGPPDSYNWVQTLPMSGLGLDRLHVGCCRWRRGGVAARRRRRLGVWRRRRWRWRAPAAGWGTAASNPLLAPAALQVGGRPELLAARGCPASCAPLRPCAARRWASLCSAGRGRLKHLRRPPARPRPLPARPRAAQAGGLALA